MQEIEHKSYTCPLPWYITPNLKSLLKNFSSKVMMSGEASSVVTG